MQGPFGIPGEGPLHRFEAQERRGWLPRGHISGLTLSNDTTDATNDVGIAAGAARSTCRIVDGTPSTAGRDQIDLELPVAVIKQADVLHAPDNYDASVDPAQGSGDRSGGRSSSSLADGSWHALLVGGPGIATDIILHDGATQALILPELQKAGGYTAYRRIGSVVRVSAAIKGFIQRENDFIWNSPPLDENVASSAGTAAVLVVLTVPLGIRVKAYINARIGDNVAYYSCPDSTDLAVSITAAPLGTFGEAAAGTATSVGGSACVWTDTSGQIRRRTIADLESRIATIGYYDPRDRDA
jgi:hypothetical protein